MRQDLQVVSNNPEKSIKHDVVLKDYYSDDSMIAAFVDGFFTANFEVYEGGSNRIRILEV